MYVLLMDKINKELHYVIVFLHQAIVSKSYQDKIRLHRLSTKKQIKCEQEWKFTFGDEHQKWEEHVQTPPPLQVYYKKRQVNM